MMHLSHGDTASYANPYRVHRIDPYPLFSLLSVGHEDCCDGQRPGGTTVTTQNISSKDATANAVVSASAPSRNETDLELVKRAQQGDAEAFAALFHAHKARVYSICVRMTNNTAQAEDLTQDAFLQVFRKLSTFKGNSALSTWLYRIAVNTVLMHFRKKALKQVSLDEPSNHDAKQVRREYGSRDGRLAGSVDRIALTRAIKDLPAGYRKIFLLHEVEGYEHQEIAKLLDCSVGNSKSQLHKAKLRIREFLSAGGTQDIRVEVQKPAPEFELEALRPRVSRQHLDFAKAASAMG
jgi:RNA polymerase sigma-70 factor, ECF subfamily